MVTPIETQMVEETSSTIVFTFCNFNISPKFAHEKRVHSNVSCHAHPRSLIIESYEYEADRTVELPNN
uniref:Uncharacterized protein n=1 Tax=Arundo donax TaxID=35708 RepID=A0A0A9EVD4_ARUDO